MMLKLSDTVMFRLVQDRIDDSSGYHLVCLYDKNKHHSCVKKETLAFGGYATPVVLQMLLEHSLYPFFW